MIGVLALQGAFREHVRALEACGASAREVSLPADLENLDGLIIPGGESTTMTLLMERMGLWEPLREAVGSGLPTLGTCAGMILLASKVIDGIEGQPGLEALDITVRRNAYGRQPESFEVAVEVMDLDQPFPGVFIRAPVIEAVGGAEVIACFGGKPVGVRQGPVMALAFHPELSGDLRLHHRFLKEIKGRSSSPRLPPEGGRE